MADPVDVIVVGSGPSGAMAAQTLVEAGVQVLMLDVGHTDKGAHDLLPEGDFRSLRESDREQWRYFLGDNLEAVDLDPTGTGAQLTPQRQHLLERVDALLPFSGANFSPLESLALGGLGAGWGLGCCVFTENELRAAGLDVAATAAAYQTVADRIGISGADDDATAHTSAHVVGVQPATALDANSQALLKKYHGRHTWFKHSRIDLGRPTLALLSEAKGKRQPAAANNMGFYSDRGNSAYRPAITIEQLKQRTNFRYHAGVLVRSYRSENGTTTVSCLQAETLEQLEFQCKRLVLAAGTLGSARIVTRSRQGFGHTFDVQCNPYFYMPCLQWSRLGKVDRGPRTSFAQLSMFAHTPTDPDFAAMASIYSYESLLLFRPVKEAPVGIKLGRELMQYIVPALSLVGIHHSVYKAQADLVGATLTLSRTNDNPIGDELRVQTVCDGTGLNSVWTSNKRIRQAMYKLGCRPLDLINPGMGSSIHYGGSLPIGKELEATGKLVGEQNVYVADGSGLTALPAKGVTFTLMANAHVVAQNVINDLKV